MQKYTFSYKILWAAIIATFWVIFYPKVLLNHIQDQIGKVSFYLLKSK